MSAVDTRSGRWMAIVSLTPISLPPFRYIVCVHQPQFNGLPVSFVLRHARLVFGLRFSVASGDRDSE
ncbi:hypothetical protein CY35_16G085400 [Sphagnum magellanicum]|nr:hypothetical protein CY35_16G085400 [Sphagnum magellanicum]